MNRHKAFVSYHHANDERYKQSFEYPFGGVFNAIVSRSVQIGDIDPNLHTDTIRRIIREDYLKDSSLNLLSLLSKPA